MTTSQPREALEALRPRYRMTAMGCSNCGGQPCASTCLVGQLEAWLQRVSHGTPSATSATKAGNA